MIFDTTIKREFYLFGKFWNGVSGAGALQESRAIRINKLDGKFMHFLVFTDQSDVTGIVHPVSTNLFLGCGSIASTGANIPLGDISYFKITSEGQKLFARRLSIQSATCQGLTYDYEKAQGTLLVLSTDDRLRVVNKYTQATA